jgi:flagellar hook-associated protein 2
MTATSTSGIQSTVGPISGINYQQLVTALLAVQQQQITDVQNQVSAAQGEQTAYQTLEANLAPLTASAQTLGQTSTFQTFQVQTSDPTQLGVTTGTNAAPGSYQFTALQQASSQVETSKGFVNEDQQSLGTGTITISSGGGVSSSTLLDALNGGQGIRRGVFRITDRSGASATIDLSNAYTVNDVLNAINDNGTAAVTATSVGGRIVLTDNSGSTAGNLTVTDASGGHAAADLGIAQSVASNTLTGQSVYQASSNTLLSQINDGNGLRTVSGAPAMQIDLSDGTSLDVNLDSAVTVGDVVNSINNASGNGGKLVASVNNGALQLTDTSGGSGTLSVSDDNSASVLNPLGLAGVSASGNTITGNSLLGGINSILLRNLNGGQGVGQTGQLQLQDRTGLNATVDLTGDQSLDQVLYAINNATTTGGQKLNLTAQVNASGTGIEINDTSGSSAANLVVQDVGGSTVASDLGIAVNSATSSVDSGRLNEQYVNDATSLSNYAPGGAVSQGSFTITDSAGHTATININSAVANVGDVIQRINAASGISVHAQLNTTGDGFVITDTAGGAGTLSIAEAGGQTASDLRILGSGTPNGSGQSEIDSRLATIVNVTSTDTLDSVVQKIQGQSPSYTASVVDDGSPFNPKHLSIASTASGQAGQFFIDESGIDLGLQTTATAQDALLKVGSGANGLIKSSSSGQFSNAQPGVNVQILAANKTPVTATVTRNDSSIIANVQSFVTNFNTFMTEVQSLTAFDTSSNTASVLEGSATALNTESQMSNIVTQSFLPPGNSVRTLIDLGISVNSDGTLSLNQSTLQNALDTNPQQVTNFFTTATTGFGAVAQKLVQSFTDPYTGTLTLESNSLQQSIDTYNDRITTLTQLMTDKQTQLEQQFAQLETFIGSMQTQQSALATISPLGDSSSSSSSSSSVLGGS